jgi:hypothetical protein
MSEFKNIPKEIKDLEEFTEWLAKYKADPENTDKKLKRVLEVWMRKNFKALKGEKLLDFLKKLNDDLPWEDFFASGGNDLMDILFKLTTYNEKYSICNRPFIYSKESFGGQNINEDEPD